jgi:hypothetical protein
MAGARGEVVLDEASTPEGPMELVVYEAKDIVWIGVRARGGPLTDAIGLHTGSDRDRYLETTTSSKGTWAVAFGGVSPEIDRVAIRNEQGEETGATVLSLPPSFNEDYRAAWGISTNCDRSCGLVGFDGTGRRIDASMVRPRGAPGERDTLELIRGYCEDSLRYLNWAVAQMSSDPEKAAAVKAAEAGILPAAIVLAYIEGADDRRSATSAAAAIRQRYFEMIESDRWQPPFGSAESDEL